MSLSLKGTPHRYVGLKVHEVSLVTEPAILNEGEDGTIGLPVIKMTEMPIPVRAMKDLGVKTGEDLLEVLKLLDVTAQSAVLQAFPQDPDAWWVRIQRVTDNTAILGEPWGRSPFETAFRAYSVEFKRLEDGTFEVTNPQKLKVQFVAVDETTKVEEPLPTVQTEEPMKTYTVKFAGTELVWPAAPGAGVKTASGLVCKCEEGGEVTVGEGYVLTDDTISEITKTEEPKTEETTKVEEPKAEEPLEVKEPEVEVEVEVATKVEEKQPEQVSKFFSLEALKEIVSASGQSVRMTISPSGEMVVDVGAPVSGEAPAQKQEPKAPAAEEARKLQEENTRLQQELNTRIVRNGELYTVQSTKEASGLGNATLGLFTHHLHGRFDELVGGASRKGE